MTPPSKGDEIADVFDALARGDQNEALDLLAASRHRAHIEVALMAALVELVPSEELARRADR